MAKKIINGRMYNTDTTEVLGSWDNGYPRGDFSFEEQTLHKKKTGEYFVYASGGAQSNLGDCYGGHDCSGEKFIPMSVEQAQQWSEEYLTVEKYVEIWGEPEEQPESLNKSIMKKYKRFIKFLMFLSCAVFYGLLCQLKIESQWVLVAKILSGGIMVFTGIKLLEKK